MTITNRPKRGKSSEVEQALKAALEDNIVKVGVYLEENLHAQFKALCSLKKTNMNVILTDYIKNFVERNKEI